MTKLTPEIERFIRDNCTLSDSVLKELLEKDFGIVVDRSTVSRFLEKARADAALENSSKVEAVREQVLDNANIYAAKYLKMIDDEITALDKILKTGSIAFDKSEDRGEESDAPGCLNVDNLKDRNATSQNLQKAISMILQFVQPANETNVNMNFKPEFSKLSDEALAALKLDLKKRLEDKQ